MKQQHSLWLASVLLMAVATRLVAAPLTTNWPFTTPSNYVVSDSNKIEVASGVAQLKKQINNIETAVRVDYLTNAVQLTNVVFGQNASLGLALSNGLYATSGVYTSRVFNGGEGNVWTGLVMRLSNIGLVPNSSSPIKLDDSGIINDPTALALYHFDGSWMDEVSSTTGTPFLSPSFTNEAFFGSHALRLNGTNYVQTVGSTILNGRSSGSIVLWMKLLRRHSSGGILVDRTLGFTGFGQNGNKVGFVVNNGTAASTSDLPLTNWCFLAGTFNAGTVKFYFNGSLESSGTCPATLTQSAPFLLGWNAYDPTWKTDGLFDEVAIYGRELSAAEIQNLYALSGPFGVRLRSGSTNVLTGAFSGPTVASGSYFLHNLTPLQPVGSFNPADQYIQYEASFYSTANQLQAPYVESLKFMGTAGEFVDDVWGDFVQGDPGKGSATIPNRHDAPFVTLGLVGNGVVSNGIFTSRVLDANSSENWTTLKWDRGVELSTPLTGIEGLWHMNETWDDNSGKGHATTVSNVTFSVYSKLGSHSGEFNGTNGSFNAGYLGAAVQSVEFWMNAGRPTMPILELGAGSAWLAISNNFVTVNGWSGTAPLIYVNAGLRSQLLPGWNHVAVVFPSAVTADNVTVGLARGGYFKGYLDELAIYTRALTSGEVATDCAVGRREVAGRIRFQARADDVNPPQTEFVGKDDNPAEYFIEPTASSLSALFQNKRYFQYQARLEGDGTAGPALSSVTVIYGGKTMGDVTKADFAAGDFGGGATRLAGDEIMLRPLFSSGPATLKLADSPGLLGLWHMDDDTWSIGTPSAFDSSGNGKWGTPNGNASVQATVPAVGLKNGAFASSGYLSFAAVVPALTDFTISGWFKTKSLVRSPLASNYDTPGQAYFALEVNGDGRQTQTGRVAFVISNGSTTNVAIGGVGGLNDGAWHHVSGVRNGGQALLYVDGVLAGSTFLSGGSAGNGALTLAKYGTQSLFLNGSLDEFALHGRALSETEIGDLAAAGYRTRLSGVVVGPVLDVGVVTYWEKLIWGCDAPYGRALVVDPSMVGLWHCDAVNLGMTGDATMNNNYGTVTAGVTVDASGRFGNCLNIGPGQQVQAGTTPTLNTFSIEAWVYVTNTVSLVVAKDGGTGFVLGTDLTGRSTLAVNGVSCTDFDLLRGRKWNLLCGTYDGQTAKLYVNGFLKATVGVPGPVATSTGLVLGETLNGKLDEAVLYDRAIHAREALDHYRAGVCSLKFQVRSWSPAAQGNFLGPDGSTNTYFTDYDGSALSNAAPVAMYFQAKATLGSEDARFSPRLDNVRVIASGFPTDNPWVAPADGYGSRFLGHLESFSHVAAITNGAQIQYQISGNNGTNWYAWNSGAWQDFTTSTSPTSQWSNSSTKDIIDANIQSFYNDIYQGTGGVFKFRAFLKSDAIQQVSLDRVDLGYSAGRIVVLAPNGTERGNNAIVMGNPVAITWSSSGAVSSTNIIIELFDANNLAVPVQTIASGVTNSGSFWWAFNVVGTNFEVRIRDGSDSSIYDWSDNTFQIVNRPHITQPNGGELWRLRDTQTINWESPPDFDNPLWLWFSSDNGLNWRRLTTVLLPNKTGTNSFSWTPSLRDPGLLSESARMAVSVRALNLNQLGEGEQDLFDASDAPFEMAGIVVTDPNGGARMGTTNTVRWISAAVRTNVTISLSVDGGTTWTNLANNVANISGTNSFDCLITAPNPTDSALIRVKSVSDATLYGDSVPFTLADIRILSPQAGVSWQLGSTNVVAWTSGGASNLVNLSYCTDGTLTNWLPIVTNKENFNSSSNAITTNVFSWVVTGPPTASAVIRIDAVSVSGLFANSDPFKITGIQLLAPLGDPDVVTPLWDFAGTNTIRWLKYPSGGDVRLDISFVEPVATNGFEFLATVAANDKRLDVLPGQVRRPTMNARVRITVLNIASNLMQMVDTSPQPFTIRGVSVVSPTNNAAKYTLGTTVTNGLQWYSAATKSKINFWYSPDGSNFTQIFSADQFNKEANDPKWNELPWTISDRLLPTKNAQIKAVAGTYWALSPIFTLRGVRIIQPAAGTNWDLGSLQNVSVLSAGLSAQVDVTGKVSTDGTNNYVSGNMPTDITVKKEGNSAFTWTIDPTLDPTTNAVIQLKVTAPPADADIVATSDPFVLRGLKILSPAVGTNWMVGSSHSIAIKAAGMDSGALVNLYYAPDGLLFNVITNNVLVNNGLNFVGWNVNGEPSSNAVLMVVSGSLTNRSGLFTVSGIKVTSPKGTDIWAVSDVTNTVKWAGVGAQTNFTLWFTVYSNSVPTLSEVIASNVGDYFYVWTMTSNAISDQVTITVTDGTLTNQSPYFSVVPAPSIRIINPVSGDFWKFSETTNVIKWSKGGAMDNDFTVSYWSTNSGLQEINHGSFFITNGIYECPWLNIPNNLGDYQIVVSNNQSSLIHDRVTNFGIAAKFEFYLLGDMFALTDSSISWVTRGTVENGVDLFYTTDPSIATNWIPVNPLAPFPVRNDVTSTYPWKVPDVKFQNVWFRVQDHNYAGRRFDASKIGPYDDLGPFLVKYYTVVWRVYDGVSSNEMNELSVSDSSGFSGSSVTSPVSFYYPAGIWNTIWFKQYFNDKVVLSWTPRVDLTNIVYMTRTEASPEYHVMANFIFDPLWNVFRAVTWLERSSKIISTTTECDVTVYDPEGNEKGVTKSFSPQFNGVYWMDIPALSESNRPYFAKVEIKSAGVVYTSGITFTLLQPSESAISAVNSARDAILGSVSNVNNNVTGVGIAVGALRGDVTNRLTSLSNTTAQIRVDVAGVSSNLSSFSSNALAQIGLLTNTVGVIGPTGTNMTDQLRNLTQEVDKRSARILTRPTSVKIGSQFNVFYRSQPGSAPILTVSNAVFFASYGMAELSGGVFEKLLTVAAGWGLGDVTLSITDGTGASDRMIVRITATEIDDLAVSMGSVSNQLAQVELILGTMSGSVSNIDRNVSGMTTNLTDLIGDVNLIYLTVSNMPGQLSYLTNVIDQVTLLTNINPAVAAMTSAVAQITVLTNMSGQLAYLTNMVGQLSGLPPQMASLTNSMAKLGLMTNTMNSMSAQMGYVTNVIDQITALTNINPAVAAMTSAVAQITVLTNMSTQLAFVTNVVGQMGVLTNLTPQMASLTNSMAKLITITNSINSMTAQMSYLTNVIDQVAALTNINPAVAALTNAVASISGLTNMGSQLNYLTNAMGQVEGLTNLTPQIASLTNMTASIALQTSSLTNLVTRMAGLTNLTPQVGYLTNMVAQLMSLTNINAQVATMTNAIGQISAMTNMPSQMNDMTNIISQLTGITNIGAQVSSMTNAIGQIAGMTNLPSQMNYMTNIMSQLTGITNIGAQVSSMTNAIAQIAGLTNLSVQVASLTNMPTQLSGMTNLAVQMASLTNLPAQMASLTNMPTQLSGMTNIIAQLAAITNIGTQVSSMTNAIGQIAAMTNMPSQMNDMTNVIGQLTGITNIGTQVSSMTNAIGTIAGMTNFSSQMNYMTNIMSQLTGITNIGPQVSSMTNAIGTIAGMTNFASQMNYMTNIMSQLTGITNISTQVSSMTNAIAQIAGLTNLSDQMNFLTNSVTQLRGLTNLTAQMASLTNLPGQVAGLTNLPYQMASLTNLPSQVDSLTNMLGQLNLATSSLTNMPTQLSGMTNIITQLAAITNIGTQVASMTNAIGQISAMTNMPSQMNYLTNVINQLSGMTNIAPQVESMTNAIGQISAMTNLPSQMNYLTNVIDQLSGMTNIAPQVASMTNAIGTIAGMTNFASQMNYMTNIMSQLTGITNIAPQVASMTNAIGQISAMTNLPSQMNYLTNVINQLSGMTNIAPQVASMTNAIGTIAGMTNFSSQLNYMTNIMSQLTGITNIAPQVASMTNAIGQIAAMTNLPSQMNYLTNVIDQLSGMTNIGLQVSSMTNAISQIAGLTNLSGQLNYLTNVVDQLSGLTNLPAQVAGLTNLTSLAGLTNLSWQIASLTNVPNQINSLSNVIGQLTGLTNMADQVAVMTNAIAQISAMTNLQAQINYLTNLPSQVSVLTNVPGQVSSLTNMTLQLSSISNLYTSIESRIGSGTDVSTMDTVFGRLAALEANVATVGSSATAAGSKASGARSQASAAAGAATRIKQEVASGQMPKVMEDLNIIRKSLESALSQVKDIPAGMSTADMAKTLNDAAETMKKMAAERGLGGQLGSPTKVEPGSLTDPKAMADLLNKLSETKAMMEATRLMMDNAINKPVVVDWLEGSK